ncbi:MAG TPA: pseudouridine synthase [Pseudomonadales bacterium]|nr:pseudouridine synthase [Pseudomonadales bacterium]
MASVNVAEQAQPYIVPPCYRDVRILYQDEALLLVEKPDLLLSVPGRLPENKDCMITRVQQHFPTATVVHRLDLDTSGIMIVPLCREAHAELSRQFQRRSIGKTYTAVLWGLLEKDEGIIELPIACDWLNRPKQKICYEHGKHAFTEYRVISRDEKNFSTRVTLHPVTGRSHQLRIHSRELGHPILGCDMYAHPQALQAAPRLMLHATEIRFTHPLNGTMVVGYSSPPF